MRVVALVMVLAGCVPPDPDPDSIPMPPVEPAEGRWQSLGPSAAYPWRFVHVPGRPDELFVGMDDGGGVWRSRDNGASFQYVSQGLLDVNAWALAIDPHAPERIFAGDGHGRGFYRSLDGGDTWAFANRGLERFEAREIMDLAIDERGHTYLATLDGLFRSDNQGESWTRAPGAGPAATSCMAVESGTSNNELTLVVATGQQDESDPEAPNRVYIASADGPFRDASAALITGGAEPAPDGALLAGVTDLAIDPRGRILVALGIGETQAGMVLRSADGGETFEKLPVETLAFFVRVAVAPSDPDAIVVTGDHGVDPAIYRSADDGRSFEAIGDMSAEAVMPLAVAFDPRDPQRLWLGTLSELLETRDGGATWANATREIDQSCGTTLAATEIAGEVVLYTGLAAHAGFLDRRNAFRTQGDAWIEMPLPSDVYSIIAVPDPAGTVLAGTHGRGLYASRDGGVSFNAATGLPTDELTVFAIASLGDRIVLAGGVSTEGPGLFRSTDAGTSFTRVAVAPPLQPTRFVQPRRLVWVSGEGGIAKSSDRGVTWQMVATFDEELGDLVVLDDAGTKLLLGNARGQLLASTDGGQTFVPASDAFTGRGQINVLEIDPRDGSLLAGIGSANIFVRSIDRISGLFRSTDDGRTWIKAIEGGMSTHVYDLAFDPEVPGRIYGAMWCSGINVAQLPAGS